MPKQLDLDLITSYVLRIGVLTSLFFIVAGVLLLFFRNGGFGYSLSYLANYSNTIGSDKIPLDQIPNGIISLDGIYYITLGLWVLIFTPITVVFSAIIEFSMAKNRLYVIMSIIVLFNIFFAMLVIPRLI